MDIRSGYFSVVRRRLDMAKRLFEINYSRSEGLTLLFRPGGLNLIPEPTMQHLKAANRELLLALKSCVDEAIERMEPESETSRGPRRVRVKDVKDAKEETA